MVRRRAAWVVGIVAVVALVLVWLGRSPPSTDKDPPRTVRAGDDAGAPSRSFLGEVVSEPGGAPVEGVEVRAALADGSVANSVSGSDGGFALEGLRAPITQLRFKRAGYQDASIAGDQLPSAAEAFWTQKLIAIPGADPEKITAIELTVTDTKREPVTSYVVTWMKRKFDDPHIRAPSRSLDVSDPAGRVLIPVAEGPYWVDVVAEGFRPSERNAVEVEKGETSQLAVTIGQSISIRGVVVNSNTKKPVVGAEVRIAGVRNVPIVFTNQQGRFELRSIVAEELSLGVRAQGYMNLDVGGVDGARSRDEELKLELTPARDGFASEVVGIGVRTEPHNEGLKVFGVLPGGPAEGKLDDGDLILEADGTPLATLQLRQRIALIRGDAGTQVELAVRKRNGKIQRVVVDRARVSVPN